MLDALVGNKASIATRESFRKRLRSGDLDDKEIEIEVQEKTLACKALKYLVCLGGNVGMVNPEIFLENPWVKKGKKKMTARISRYFSSTGI